MSNELATVRIVGKDHYDTYDIPYDSGNTLLDALVYIYTHVDGSLAFRYHCRAGYCVGRAVERDGKPVLACTTYMTKEMTIRPLRKRQLVRDLITTLRDSFH